MMAPRAALDRHCLCAEEQPGRKDILVESTHRAYADLASPGAERGGCEGPRGRQRAATDYPARDPPGGPEPVPQRRPRDTLAAPRELAAACGRIGRWSRRCPA